MKTASEMTSIVGWGVKLYSNQTMCTVPITFIAVFAAHCDTLQ